MHASYAALSLNIKIPSNVPRKSNVEAETFDLRAYVRELFLAIALRNLPNKKPES